MKKDNIYIPAKDKILSAQGKTIADVIAHDLKVLFCGINPGLYSAAVGHHFGRPGNRFWPVLAAYKAAFNQPKAKTGRQEEKLHNTIIWILPNPSGLNAHYNIEGLTKLFRELKESTEKDV
jgi:G:T/U-mismatch repair DNA glycosylase